MCGNYLVPDTNEYDILERTFSNVEHIYEAVDSLDYGKPDKI